ncbi:replication initiation protein [Tortoise microvirus 79]|nr:replication initiation protein [Tortoise microvirus 79]
MCIAPVRLDNGLEVACRDCWQCRANRVNDWVGRCIAESKSSVASHMVTLTYGRGEEGTPDHPHAVYLTYSDVQKFLKRLRKDKFPVRYFAVGEYGSAKGRAHWHIIMFWKQRVPEHQLDKRIHIPYWDYGFTFWQEVSYESFRYAAKYIQKDIGAETRQAKQVVCRMSKLPPLGMPYFRELAERYVVAKMAPQDLFYYWPEVLSRTGQKVQFKLQGRSAELFLEHYAYVWRMRYPGVHMPVSELVEEYLDAQVSDEVEMLKFESKLRQRDIEYQRKKYAVPPGLSEAELERMFHTSDVTQLTSLSEEMQEWRRQQWLEEVEAAAKAVGGTSYQKLLMEEEWQRRKGA